MSLSWNQWDWWLSEDGENLLAGTDCDPANPPHLADWLISSILTDIPAARDSFNYYFPLMLPDEQLRLLRIIQGVPQFVALDPLAVEDNFQNIHNSAGVHRGGGWAPPPFKP